MQSSDIFSYIADNTPVGLSMSLETQKTLFGNWYTIYVSRGVYDLKMEFEEDEKEKICKKINEVFKEYQGGNKPTPQPSYTTLKEFCEYASEVVKTWPKWKQNILKTQMQPYREEPRK